MWNCWLPYFGIVKLCIQDLELSYTQPLCCRGFTAAKIFPNHKLEKVKENFYTRFKQENTASLHMSSSR